MISVDETMSSHHPAALTAGGALLLQELQKEGVPAPDWGAWRTKTLSFPTSLSPPSLLVAAAVNKAISQAEETLSRETGTHLRP